MSTPPPLPSRFPPKLPKPSPLNSSKFSDASAGDSSGQSPHSRRPPVAPRKPHRLPELNGSTTSSSSSPPPAVFRGTSVSTDDGSSQEGFGRCLQQGYEAITKKHEDELLALESLRGHIFHRARADKEYAESLLKMNQKANKKLANIDQSSAAVQVYDCITVWALRCVDSICVCVSIVEYRINRAT